MDSTGINIPCNKIHQILRDEDLVSEHPKKSRRRKWIRFERTYSNSMWHTDYKHLDDGRWFLCYEDDASRFVTGYGMFEHATTENALTVLEEAIKNHGKSASIMTDRGFPVLRQYLRQRRRVHRSLRKNWSSLE